MQRMSSAQRRRSWRRLPQLPPALMWGVALMPARSRVWEGPTPQEQSPSISTPIHFYSRALHQPTTALGMLLQQAGKLPPHLRQKQARQMGLSAPLVL